MPTLLETAQTNLGDSIREALMYTTDHQALVVFDARTELSSLLTTALRHVLPTAAFIDFDATQPEQVLAAINALKPQDLVILIQSTNFRLNEFRFRIELFNRQLKTMEVSHLERIKPEHVQAYIESLAYDPQYYRPLGQALKERVDKAKNIIVRCEGTELVYRSEMEPAKLNIGDYRGMKNVGGTFPIGEIFTEAKDLSAVNGEVMICALGDLTHQVYTPKPFKAIITNGILTAPDAPDGFKKTLELISDQEAVLVREFGLGLNRAMNKNRIVGDITAFERMNGLHLSLGSKHGVYKKPGLNPKKTRYHIDVFVDVQTITVDGEIIFANGTYLPKV